MQKILENMGLDDYVKTWRWLWNHTTVKLLSQGVAPSVQKIKEELGTTGSNTTIAEHLKFWRNEYAKKTIYTEIKQR